jgi:hypothetical protein
MLRFGLLLAVLAWLLVLPGAAAQGTSPAQGVATFEIQPNRLELEPGAPKPVQGWVNATIQCESGYAPEFVEIYAEQASLQDEEEDDAWTVDPGSFSLEFTNAGNDRYQANMQVQLEIGAAAGSTMESGRIEFAIFNGGGPFPSNDCALFGSRWRFTNEPYIDVVRPPPPEEPPIDESTQPAEAAPATFTPSQVIVEGGPVKGESRIPGEAFWSLGLVLGLFASSAAYGLRRR